MSISSFDPHGPLPPSEPRLLTQEQSKEALVKIAMDRLTPPQRTGEERVELTFKELMRVNELTEKAVPQFKAAIKAQRLDIVKLELVPEEEEEALKQLDQLEGLIPIFVQNKAKSDAVFEAFDLIRTPSDKIPPETGFPTESLSVAGGGASSGAAAASNKTPPSAEFLPAFQTVSQWGAIAAPFLDWVEWSYKNRPPALHGVFNEMLTDYHNQGLGTLIKDHYQLAQKEWVYLNNHLSTPPTSDELFQLTCLKATITEAKAQLNALPDKLQRFITWFEQIPERTSEQQKGLTRLRHIKEGFSDNLQAYTALLNEVESKAPRALLEKTQVRFDAMTPEAREVERVRLVDARPPIQVRFLEGLWNNVATIFNPSEWSDETRKAVGTSLNALQFFQRVMPTTTQRVAFTGRTASSRETQEVQTQKAVIPPDIPNKAATVTAAATAATPFFSIQESIRDLSRGLGLEESDQCYSMRDTSRRLTAAFTEEREELEREIAANDAALEDCGTKYRNVVHQQRLVDLLQLPGVKVPTPQAISSTKMHTFLRAVQPEIFSFWKNLKMLYERTEDKNQFLNRFVVKIWLEAIDQKLVAAFEDPDSFDELRLDPSVQRWLNSLLEQGSSLMIRSTGAEDTRESANAGGNLSVPYVSPTEAAFTQSVGDVVRSYFGERSLQNRINAGRNPFAEPLKLAVMAQEVIGETVGGASNPSEIPRSLVLFTNEPLYIGGEAFRAMRFSASYGHGEGVVGEQGIGTDTVNILFSLAHPDEIYILYSNQDKPERLAPIQGADGTVTLQKVSNPPELQRRRVFNEEEIKHLVRWALIGESYFGGEPTDMELVTKMVDGQFVIYPVQARPVNRPPPSEPSYLDRTKLRNAGSAQLRAETIVPGSSVITLTKPDELLIAPSLKEAESRFQKGVHKAVLVGNDEPANSHPVVNFSNLGIPCFYFRGDTTSFLSKLQAGKQGLVCAQTATFQIVEPDDSVVSKGFIVHPARLGTSLTLTDPLPQASAPKTSVEEAHNQLFHVNTAKNNQEALQYLDALSQSTFIQAFEERSRELKRRCDGMAIIPEEVRKTLLALQEVEERVDRSFAELQSAYAQGGGRLEPLLHLKVLGELLFQPKEGGSTLGRQSVEGMLHAIEGSHELLTYQERVGNRPARFIPSLLEGSKQPDNSLYQEWKGFLLQLEEINTDSSLAPALEQFEERINVLSQAQVLPTYLLFFFRESEGKEVRERLNILNQMFSEQDLASFVPFLNDGRRYATLQSRLPTLTSKASIEAFAAELKQEAEALHLGSLGWDPNASPMMKILLLKKMNQFVDLYDSGIKEMKRSNLPPKEKVRLFKQMLQPYYELMVSWVPLTSLTESGLIPISDYLRRIKVILDATSDEVNQMDPSRGFSVNAAQLGSQAQFERHNPSTMEDVFTLCHQNLLTVTSTLLKGALSLEQLFRGDMAVLARRADQVGEIRGIRLIGITQGENQVVLSYNIPIRNHAAKINLIYKKGGEIVFDGLLLGEARGRWQVTADVLNRLERAGLLSFTERPKWAGLELHFAARWNAEDDAPLEGFQGGVEISLGSLLLESLKKKVRESIKTLESFVKIVSPFPGLALEWFVASVEKRFSVEEALPLLKEVFKDSDQDVRLAAVGALSALIEKGLSVDEALPLLKEMFKDSDRDVRLAAVGALSALIEKGLSVDEALPLLKEVLNDSDRDVRRAAVGVISTLIKKGLSADEALPLLKEVFKHSDPNVRLAAVGVISTFIEKGLSVDETLTLLKEVFKDSDPYVRKVAVGVISTLIEKGLSVDEALPLLKEALKHSYLDVRLAAVRVLPVLVEKSLSADGALLLLEEVFKDSDPNVRLAAVRVLSTLIEEGLSIDKGLPLLGEALRDSDRDVRQAAVGVLPILIEKGLSIDKGLPLLGEALRDSDRDVRRAAVGVLPILIEKGLSIDKGLPLLGEALGDSDQYVRQAAVGVLPILIEKGLSIDKGLLLLGEALRDSDRDIRQVAVEVLLILIEKGLLDEEALPLSEEVFRDVEEVFRDEDSTWQALGRAERALQFLVKKGLLVDKPLFLEVLGKMLKGEYKKFLKSFAYDLLSASAKRGGGSFLTFIENMRKEGHLDSSTYNHLWTTCYDATFRPHRNG